MIVSKNTQNALFEIIGEAFALNRKIDRMVSILGTKFAYNQTANLVHHGIAHYYPILADSLGERCLERYNIPVFYAATPEGGQVYSSVIEIIKDLEKANIEFQSMMMGCTKIAFDNNDIHVYADLLDLLEDVNEVVSQVILLSDKIDIYKDSPAYDHDIPDFWILGENK
nr:MAG TPA: hypothetical protein [Caudoviricetes sp.]